jgi:hypothetical protein
MGLITTVEESLTKAFTQDTTYTATTIVWMSLHSANPGSTGTSEVTSGSGTAGRQQVTFSGSAGTDTNTGDISFVLTAETVFWIGYWTAQTVGTFLGGFPLVGAGSILAAANGVVSMTAPAHGRSVNNIVRLFTTPGAAATAVPAAFSADTLYYVVNVADADHLELSATHGGSPITPTGAGSCGMYLDESQTSMTGTLTFPTTTGIQYLTVS